MDLLSKKRIKTIIKVFKLGTLALFLIVIAVILSNYLVEKNAQGKLYDSTKLIKKNKVGLVLGTAKYLRSGNINLYYKYRLNAVTDLYKAGKIEYILISGDNGRKTYDEPTDFKNDLIKRGIPAKKIFLDFAGFRTLDSVVRSKHIFGQNEITFISQKFHNERAIYLAESNNIKAIGYNARAINGKYGIKVKIREYFARTKVFIDIILNIQPKFLGKKITIK